MLTVKKLTAEANVQFNGKKDISDYSNSGEDNLIYAPKGGMPAWMIYNLKMAYKITKSFTAQAGIDNILDTNYRVFASGINGPGRNIYLALRLRI
jgi:hemoglobin/transferrin/lactoferrin receptor protein